MAASTLEVGGLFYNNTNTTKATAVTVTADYTGVSLKSSGYGSSVVTITAARDKAINITGNAKANKITGTSANDTLTGGDGNDTLIGGSGKDVFIYDGKGTDVISDYTAGEDTIKIASGSISSYSFSGSDAVFKVGKGSVKVKGGKSSAITVVDSKSKTFTYDGGLIYNNAPAKASAMTVTAAYGNTLKADSYGAAVVTIDSSARTKALNIAGNSKANKITGTSGNDTINGGAGNDTLTGGKGKDIFIYESGGGNDVIDDYAEGQDTIKIVSGEISAYSVSGSDAVFKIDKGTLKVKGGKSSAITIIDADKHVSTYQNGAIYNNAKSSKATAITLTSAYGSSITAGSTVITVDAAARTSAIKIVGNTKNNILTGGSGKDVIDGGKGNDSISGGKGGDTLTGGAGNDVFIYANGDGSDLIMDYVAGEDVIKLTSGEVKSYSVKNGDAILKVGTGAITVKSAGYGAVSVLDANDVLTVYNGGLIYNDPQVSKADVVTVTADFEGELGSYGANVETIDASARSKAINITGNAADNFILGGKGKDTISGGKGADTISGGKGNDILTGGAGADVFLYAAGEGNDTITDYAANEDVIQLSSGTLTSYTTKNGDAILKIGAGNITVKDAADLAIRIVGEDGTASLARGGNITEAPPALDAGKIPRDAVQYNGHYYYIYDKGATWSEAETFAENLGGHLLTITDADEQAAIESLLAAHENPRNSYWLGGYKNIDNSWQWITGETLSYTNFAQYEPDNYGEIENRLVLYQGKEFGKWNDLNDSGEIEIWGADFFGTKNLGMIVEWDEYSATDIAMNGLIFNAAKTSATLSSIYSSATFDAADYSSLVSIDASATNGVNLTGNSNANVIIGSKGNDTLTGGEGKDVFIFEGKGDFDVITDYTEGEDIISIGANSITGDMLVGSDVIFTVGDGVLKLENAKDKHVTIHSNNAVIEYITEYTNDSVTNEETVEADTTGLIFNSAKTAVTVTTDYKYDSFNSSYYSSLVSVNNKADSVSVYGGSGNDSVYNSGRYVAVITGDGKDSIENRSGGVKLNTGSGDDYIFSDLRSAYTIRGDYGYVTIDGGTGNDTIYSNDPYISIVGGEGDDSISLGSYPPDLVTINGGKGNDTLNRGNGYGSSIGSILFEYANGDGNDIIYNFKTVDTLQISGGSFSTTASGSNLIVSVGTGRITIVNGSGLASHISGTHDPSGDGKATTGSDTTPAEDTVNAVSLTSGDDTYSNTESSVIIYALAGNDGISNDTGTSGVTLDAGTGNDTIRNYSTEGTVYLLNAGDGASTILGYSENDTIYVAADTYTTSKSGENFVIKAGSDSLVLRHAANFPVIVADSTGAVQTCNTDGSRVLKGDNVSTELVNTNSRATITGNATYNIINNYGSSVLAGGGAGVDYITNHGDSVTIVAGAEEDYVWNYGAAATINAGRGNDIVYLNSSDGSFVQYASGDGNDVLYNISANDTLQISGASYSTVASGSDVIVSVGSGKITLVGAGSLSSVNIVGEYDSGTGGGEDTVPVPEGFTVVSLTTGDDEYTVTSSRQIVYALAGDDTISNSGLASVAIFGGAGDDSINNSRGSSVTIDGGAGNDTIYYNDYALNSSGSVVSYYDSYASINGGDGNDSIQNKGTSVTIDGGNGNDTIQNSVGAVTIDGGAGNDSIQNYSNGGNIYQLSSGTGTDTVWGYNENDTIYVAASSYTTSKSGENFVITAGTDSLILSHAANFTITVKNSAGTVQTYNSSGTRVITADNLDSEILNTNSRATIKGRAYYDHIDNLGSSVTIDGGDGNDSIYNSGYNVTIDGGDGNDSIYNSGASVTIDGGAGNDYIDNYGDSVTIDGGAGNDYIYNSFGSRVTIDGGEGDDSIYNWYGDSVKIDGGAGADLISLYSGYAGYGDNTIAGGTGDDAIYMDSTTTVGNVFQYANGDGNDVIYNLSSYDTIQISGSYSTQTSGSDVIVSVGSGSITIKDYTGTLNIQSASNGNAPVPWFTEDDTLTTGGDLDSLIETSIANSSGDISMRGGNSNALTDFPPEITYADDK